MITSDALATELGIAPEDLFRISERCMAILDRPTLTENGVITYQIDETSADLIRNRYRKDEELRIAPVIRYAKTPDRYRDDVTDYFAGW